MDLAVRSYMSQDAKALGEVFYRSVREGAARVYEAKQVEAWSPEPPTGDGWGKRLAEADTVVAVNKRDPVGFMALDAKGYLDLAFVLPEAMGQGVSDAIYAVLEGRARARGVPLLTTQASLLAEPFFSRHGWRIVRRQDVEIGGVVLKNAWMEKSLERAVA